jgi:sugar lactone lactonase YvrE
MRRACALLPLLLGLAGAAGPVPPCEDGGASICGLDRPEDVTRVPGTALAVVSTASADEPLLLVDLDTGRRERLVASGMRGATRRSAGADDCAGPPTTLHAAGHDARRVGRTLRIAVLNRETGSRATRVELYTLRHGAAPAEWSGCVPVPAQLALNDVALGRSGELYASHMFDPATPRDELRQRFLDRVPTGAAWKWTHAEGWRAVPGSDVSFANGIALLRDGRTLAVAATYGQEVAFVDLATGAVRRVAVPLQPDNLSLDDDGAVLATGHTGTPVSGVDPCRDPASKPCGFPFAVARVTRAGAVQVLFEHDGRRWPGASVAVRRGARLYLGSAFGDRIAAVDVVAGRERAAATSVTKAQ